MSKGVTGRDIREKEGGKRKEELSVIVCVYVATVLHKQTHNIMYHTPAHTLFLSLASLAPNLTEAIPICSSSHFLISALGPSYILYKQT